MKSIWMWGPPLVLCVFCFLAWVPDRLTRRTALYRLAIWICELLVKIGTLFPALASVIEEFPRRVSQEWRAERINVALVIEEEHSTFCRPPGTRAASEDAHPRSIRS